MEGVLRFQGIQNDAALGLAQYRKAIELNFVNDKLRARILNNKAKIHFQRDKPAEDGALSDSDLALLLSSHALQCQFEEWSTRETIIFNVGRALAKLVEEGKPSQYDLIQACMHLSTLECTHHEARAEMLLKLATVLYEKKEQAASVQLLEKAHSLPLQQGDLKLKIVKQLLYCKYTNPLLLQFPPACNPLQ